MVLKLFPSDEQRYARLRPKETHRQVEVDAHVEQPSEISPAEQQPELWRRLLDQPVEVDESFGQGKGLELRVAELEAESGQLRHDLYEEAGNSLRERDLCPGDKRLVARLRDGFVMPGYRHVLIAQGRNLQQTLHQHGARTLAHRVGRLIAGLEQAHSDEQRMIYEEQQRRDKELTVTSFSSPGSPTTTTRQSSFPLVVRL